MLRCDWFVAHGRFCFPGGAVIRNNILFSVPIDDHSALVETPGMNKYPTLHYGIGGGIKARPRISVAVRRGPLPSCAVGGSADARINAISRCFDTSGQADPSFSRE